MSLDFLFFLFWSKWVTLHVLFLYTLARVPARAFTRRAMTRVGLPRREQETECMTYFATQAVTLWFINMRSTPSVGKPEMRHHIQFHCHKGWSALSLSGILHRMTKDLFYSSFWSSEAVEFDEQPEMTTVHKFGAIPISCHAWSGSKTELALSHNSKDVTLYSA